MELKRFVPCACQSHIPQVVDWLLTNRSDVSVPPGDVFECLVDVGYVSSVDRNGDLPIRFLPDPRYVTIHASVSKSTVTVSCYTMCASCSAPPPFGRSVCLSVCPSVCLSVCLSVRLSLSLWWNEIKFLWKLSNYCHSDIKRYSQFFHGFLFKVLLLFPFPLLRLTGLKALTN